MQQTKTGATPARGAGFDRERVPHLALEPNPALVRQADQRAQSIENRDIRSDHRVRRLDAVRLHPHRLVRLLDRVRRREATRTGC